jgi:hypothetical protein
MIARMAAPLTADVDCPNPPPSRESTYARALHRACLVLGGADQLSRHLGVSEAALLSWLEGREDPPQMVFLAAVEIVLLHLDGPGATN